MILKDVEGVTFSDLKVIFEEWKDKFNKVYEKAFGDDVFKLLEEGYIKLKFLDMAFDFNEFKDLECLKEVVKDFARIVGGDEVLRFKGVVDKLGINVEDEIRDNINRKIEFPEGGEELANKEMESRLKVKNTFNV